MVTITAMRSIQPTKKPANITIKQMTSLNAPPFLKNVDHLTKISVIQFTPGISSKII